MRRFGWILGAALLVGLLQPALAQPTQSIVQTLQGDPRFTTLVNLVQRAGLVETLQGPGPFTVFAPTNEAFAKLPPDVTNALLADNARLRDVLLHHVAYGSLPPAVLVRLNTLATLQGRPLTVSRANNRPTVNGVRADGPIEATNGLIYVLDSVLLPPESSLATTLMRDPRFSTFVRAADVAGLTPMLVDSAPLIVFAPTNDAFAKLPAGTVDNLLANPAQLRRVLLYHIAPGMGNTSELVRVGQVQTLLGPTVSVRADGDVIRVNGAAIVAPNITARNGIIQGIDTVLMPPAE